GYLILTPQEKANFKAYLKWIEPKGKKNTLLINSLCLAANAPPPGSKLNLTFLLVIPLLISHSFVDDSKLTYPVRNSLSNALFSSSALKEELENILNEILPLDCSQKAKILIVEALMWFLDEINISIPKVKTEFQKALAEKKLSDLKRISKDLILFVAGKYETGGLDPILKLFITALVGEEIFKAIDEEEIKDGLEKRLLFYTGLPILGYILLRILIAKVKVAVAPEYILSYIYLSDNQVFLIDFLSQEALELNLDSYYKEDGKCWVLRENYWINWEEAVNCLGSINQGKKIDGLSAKSLESQLTEKLYSLYFTLRLSKNSKTLFASVYNNCGVIWYLLAKGDGEKGRIDQALLRYKKAEVFYRKAFEVDVDPDCAEAYNNLGVVYFILGKEIEKAYFYYFKAFSINPNLFTLYQNFGDLYFKLASDDQIYYLTAVKAYKEELKINPFNPMVYSSLQHTYLSLSKFEKGGAGEYKQLAKSILRQNLDFKILLQTYYSGAMPPQLAKLAELSAFCGGSSLDNGSSPMESSVK
ncbi:MAG: hypothetical protein QMD94_03925, partial [Candidatus Omnitrophota bacterium]|nr:hypothetical protein [Candidatus Omnitrophota bacterium]